MELPAICTRMGQKEAELTLTEAVDVLVSETQVWPEVSDTQRKHFLSRVSGSIQAIRRSLGNRALMARLENTDLCFEDAEATLFAGHSVHPCPKARDGFGDEDIERYTPEYGQSFRLFWYAVIPDHLRVMGDPGLWDAIARSVLPDRTGLRWLPVHPFQHRRWEISGDLARWRALGWVRDVCLAGPPWRPTSSVRTLYASGFPWMFKSSLSVRLTNSLRHLREQELQRGALLSDILREEAVQSWKNAHPAFHILEEPVAAVMVDTREEALEATAASWRSHPFGPGQRVQPLALLLQPHPISRVCLLERLIGRAFRPEDQARDWLRGFLDLVVAPLLEAQGSLGLLFGAHQQNLLLELSDGLPCRAWFRDCQGTGFTPLARDVLDRSVRLHPSAGNCISAALGAQLLTYYLFVNSAFQVMAMLSRFCDERDLRHDLRQWLQADRWQKLRDRSVVDALLTSPVLYSKRNFYLAFSGVNENSATDISSLYTTWPNPLVHSPSGNASQQEVSVS
ncbi:IucA/IucC family protein [Hahella sp. SMD15-11]|uniref:IucA/IucC family protein n=1 Tax=Thermohahella caldifontis TaxID=3142973 RepID=A0AB39UT36_9GAMM